MEPGCKHSGCEDFLTTWTSKMLSHLLLFLALILGLAIVGPVTIAALVATIATCFWITLWNYVTKDGWFAIMGALLITDLAFGITYGPPIVAVVCYWIMEYPGHKSVALSCVFVFAQTVLGHCAPYIPTTVLMFTCGFAGVALATLVEAHLALSQGGGSSDPRFIIIRRRRTSPSVLGSIFKPRRTSLPAISNQRLLYPSLSFTGSPSTVDVALLSEAHGLVTDMLADPSLPPHVVGGLRALATLLAPPNHTIQPRLRPGGTSVSLVDFNSGSDTEEIPYTGERPSALPKVGPHRLKRNIPPSLLRRMSTSTWTTTTSATGLPTLEPEPSRKRSTSFRHPTDTSPGSTLPPNNSPSPKRTLSPNQPNPSDSPPPKGRSTSLPSNGSSPAHRKTSRDRRLPPAPPEPPAVEEPKPQLPSIRRVNTTSDYESSNESPGNSDYNEAPRVPIKVLPGGEYRHCMLCGGKTWIGRSPSSEQDVITPSVPEMEEKSECESGDEQSSRYIANGAAYDTESLAHEPLLNTISKWDYPIFSLELQAGDQILSQMCYRTFLEVGLFEVFRIPLDRFFLYFHALECGYREKPYHNRMHAADVLQGVYYFTSQPIPGFVNIFPEIACDSPLNKSIDKERSNLGTPVHRQSFIADDNYGMMGANFPALELMALYAAAAMHDYDHPGRTNAFLVSTSAQQAVLYNDRSVLENHHAAAAWNLLLSRPEFNWLCYLDKAEFKRFRFLVIECILATDLKRHFEILAEFNAKANDDEASGIDWTSESDRLLVMEMCVKLTDINGPCKQKDIHIQWTQRIAEEFYEQGDEESKLGLPISPYMDRTKPQLAKLQESFINHLVAPLCNAYGGAGLLPGLWSESDDSEEEEVTLEEDVNQGSGESDDNTACASTVTTKLPKSRKVTCLQTLHLQENYEYWISILKEEVKEEVEEKPVEDEMETIQEEESGSTPTKA